MRKTQYLVTIGKNTWGHAAYEIDNLCKIPGSNGHPVNSMVVGGHAFQSQPISAKLKYIMSTVHLVKLWIYGCYYQFCVG